LEKSCFVKREDDDYVNPFDVAVVKNVNIVGHVPRTISAVCSLFLCRGGSIGCLVTGSRCYSWDLPQGGLEIPCKLGNSKYVSKSRKLLSHAAAPTSVPTTSYSDQRGDQAQTQADHARKLTVAVK